MANGLLWLHPNGNGLAGGWIRFVGIMGGQQQERNAMT